jgi:predicted ferric reductase
VFFVMLSVAAGSADTERGRVILAAVQRFLLFYSGVIALIALTAAVGVGLVATDRIIMRPAGRIVAQGMHRAVSFAALAFLVLHIVTETLARRSRVVDAFVPFLARGRTFYLGLGTIAAELIVILVMTGIGRAWFVGRWPWAWRVIHAAAYLCWLLALVHGLRAGRMAMPYVDWSYGACVAVVGLALVVKLAAGAMCDRRLTAAHPVPDRGPEPVPAAMPVITHAGRAAGAHARRGRRLRRGALSGRALPGPRRRLLDEPSALLRHQGEERS